MENLSFYKATSHSDHTFSLSHTLDLLRHHLPAQAPLKDFVHHNTLHAFQYLPFHEALQQASEAFGYQVYLSMAEYRKLYEQEKISPQILRRVIAERKGAELVDQWTEKLLNAPFTDRYTSRLEQVRPLWKQHYHISLEKLVHPILFRLLGNYLDQGISIWKFPVGKPAGLLDAVRQLEQKSAVSLFGSKRVRGWLQEEQAEITHLLEVLVGRPEWFEAYLLEQQFAHPGWSGMVAVLEEKPETLLDPRPISLQELLRLELLLEIDALDQYFGQGKWQPIGTLLGQEPQPLFAPSEDPERYEAYALWQEAFEWSYYDQVLRGMQLLPEQATAHSGNKNFQVIACIDDRICSFRRYLEKFDPTCQTYGTAGFFNMPFYFQPEHGKFMTKVCPAPMTPRHLVRETEAQLRHKRTSSFNPHSFGVAGGWLLSQTVGLWSAFKLAANVFRPARTPIMVSSFAHMDPHGKLEIAYTGHSENGLQLGFTGPEMAELLGGLLSSIGLAEGFAPLVYVVGHGASSVNNTHYAGYDCGACSGRAGSVNARVTALMANDPQVRQLLAQQGILIPTTTQFIGALHDTTRDEIVFYDTDALPPSLRTLHNFNEQTFQKALSHNAKERSRRFALISSNRPAEKVHREVKKRSVSLFEPRPEWNHATNALCIVGRRQTNRHLFLDRRSFLNSYDYRTDPDGQLLLGILKAVAPVCGGINLEYYFSRTDNQRLGAGTKLPHNVMGLLGVANGMDGDLRPGLPRQMINIHDPLRLLVIVEQYPERVLEVLQAHPPTYEWFAHEWVHLTAVHPETRAVFRLVQGNMQPYQPLTTALPQAKDLETIFESASDNLPVFLLPL